jgi:hypothetical protein
VIEVLKQRLDVSWRVHEFVPEKVHYLKDELFEATIISFLDVSALPRFLEP